MVFRKTSRSPYLTNTVFDRYFDRYFDRFSKSIILGGGGLRIHNNATLQKGDDTAHRSEERGERREERGERR